MRKLISYSRGQKPKAITTVLRTFLLTATLTLLIIQKGSGQNVFIFPDRLWALSGDTIWFSLAANDETTLHANVVHVQLETTDQRPVTRTMVLLEHGFAYGYLVIPDALASGGYWLNAFQKGGASSASRNIPARHIAVYNRFGDTNDMPTLPDIQPLSQPKIAESIQLIVPQADAQRRDQVSIKVELPVEAVKNINQLTISGGYENPAGESNNSFFDRPHSSTSFDSPSENNGFYIDGKVTSTEPLPERLLVLLSIPGENPHFDYYLTNNSGYFRFKLNQTFGTAELILRVISTSDAEFGIALTGYSDKSFPSTSSGEITLPAESMQNLTSMREAAQFEKIYSGEQIPREPFFSITPTYPYPFYGRPDRRVVPAEFIDLPNFLEISRELLPAVRFRQRAGSFQLQVLDELERKFFDYSPLRLINGVPVFDDQLLNRFQSNDIAYIDLIYRERIFGDISFKGVVAIVLHSDDSSWLSEEKNLFRFTIPALLPTVNHPPKRVINELANLPDFSRVLLFEKIDLLNPQPSFQIKTSDLKGTIVVRLDGVTHNQEPFSLIQKISVR